MAKKCLIVKAARKPKFSSRRYNRCGLCGRPRAFYRNGNEFYWLAFIVFYNACECCVLGKCSKRYA